MAQTTDELLALARARAFWPDGDDGPLTSTELLALLTAEMRNVVYPTVAKLRQDYHIFRESITLVSGQAQYRMPKRAHGSRVIALEIVDGNGRAWKPVQMRRVDLARDGDVNLTDTTSDPSAVRFYLMGNRIGLWPAPSFSGTLYVYYPLNPPKYVAESSCRAIATYNGSTTITVSSSVATLGWSSSSTVDIIAATGPGEPLLLDAALSGGPTTTITLSTTPPLVHGVNDIAAGDWISLAGQSCVVSLPEAGFSALCDLLVARMHESQGDDSAYVKATQRAQDGLRQMFELFADRTDDESETYIPESSALWGAG